MKKDYSVIQMPMYFFMQSWMRFLAQQLSAISEDIFRIRMSDIKGFQV